MCIRDRKKAETNNDDKKDDNKVNKPVQKLSLKAGRKTVKTGKTITLKKI